MLTKYLKDRFRISQEELAKLGDEFNSEAIPLLEVLHKNTHWILLDNRQTKKIVEQVFYEAIENCHITKNNADWTSWIQRIWIRELLEFYSKKENDIKTNFEFIDLTEINLNDVKNNFNSPRFNDQISESLKKLPAVLRIPLIMKEIHLLNYERIAELIDVPEGVIATRIYRARKLLYLFMLGNFDYEDQKRKFISKDTNDYIFKLRNYALLVDSELSELQQSKITMDTESNDSKKAEIFVQSQIKSILKSLPDENSTRIRIIAKIEAKAKKRFSGT